MPKQILMQSIKSKSFKKNFSNIGLENNQLNGSFDIHAAERVDLVNLMFSKKKNSYIYASSKSTTIQIATNAFQYDNKSNHSDELSYYSKNELGYESYVENMEINRKLYASLNEEIKTVFTVIQDDEIAGFYDFDLSVSHEKGQAMLILNLNQIYVKPKNRGSTCWMDLTIAVHSFVSAVIVCVANQLTKPHYLDVYVNANFYNQADEKIAVFIESELRATYESLPEIAPNRPAFIGNVIADMGF